MGSGESRFPALLVEGSEEEAWTLWKDNFDLQMNFQPNLQIKASPFRDTPLHCTVRHEMKMLTAEFLSNGADPFAKNGNGETPLHLACRSSRSSSRYSKRKAEFLKLLLDRIPLEETLEVIHRSSSVEDSMATSTKSGLFSSLLQKDKPKDKSAEGALPLLLDGLVSLPDNDAHHLGVQDKVNDRYS